MPRILFVHENFPAQFGALAGFLRAQGWQVMFATASDRVADDKTIHDGPGGIKTVRYKRHRDGADSTHHYLRGTEKAVLNAQGFARTAAALNRGGYVPDIVVGHSGWGSASLAKVVWPQAKFVMYLEWWYAYPAIDFPDASSARSPEDQFAATLCRNLPFLLDAQTADSILTPTEFQASVVPDWIKPRVTVLHDGVDTNFYSPATPDDARFAHDGLPDDAPIVTYATRGMEPMRGFPEFMAAWEQVQNQHPDAHCVIAGNDSVHYAQHLPKGDSYRQRALKAGSFDMSRLHFVGLLPRDRYRDLLRRSAAHAYLTRPFVLSWSLIEAMATGCPLVVSNTAPVLEALGGDQASAHRVDMADIDALSGKLSDMLSDPDAARVMGQAARARAVAAYSTADLFPAHADLFAQLLANS